MTWRLRITLIALIFGFLLITLRLFYWQVIRGTQLEELGESQYLRIVTLTPQRGEIRTSDGFPIVTNKISYLVFANPKVINESLKAPLIKDKKKIYNTLSPILEVEKASLSAKLSQDHFWVPLKGNIDIKTKKKIESLNLPGVGFEEHYSRFYPEASMAAQLLGFVGKDERGSDKGYFGIEGYYDRLLRGKTGVAIQIHDAFGKPILAKENPKSSQIHGSSLVLSIDRSIQFMVEKKLKEGIEKYGAASGMVAVMEPKTGSVLAMASFPSFDPRKYQEYSQDLFKNPFITDLFEPGSTFKPVVMSSALQVKVVKPQTKCNICQGPIVMGEYIIRTWNNKYFKDINMVEIIQRSDNTGMVFVSQKLGLDRMLTFLKKFGIGESTGIDLQGEVAPGLKPRESWYKVDLATASFGQGISVTAIELLYAISTIANGGVRMEPHVVSAVETADGKTVKINPKVLEKPINSAAAKVMTEMMVNAVNNGEAKWTRLKGYRVAGKTGTASIPIKGHYDPEKTITSFVGFAPADDPKFAILVVLNKPTSSIFGADTAAPIFFDIAKDLLSYYQIPPSGN